MTEPGPVRGREGQTFEGKSRFVRYANFVKLPHTLFALPFALVGVTIASYVKRVSLLDIVWVAIAFTAARFAAMGFNRIADRHIDALNPRTAARELPSGAMSVREASLAVLCACAIFIAAAWILNPLCLALSPERCEQLELGQMSRGNNEAMKTAFTVTIDASARFGVTTGISASDRATTIRVAVDPDTRPHDLRRPGHVNPLRALLSAPV